MQPRGQPSLSLRGGARRARPQPGGRSLMSLRPLLLGLLLPATTLAQARIVVQPPSIRVEIAPPTPMVEAPPPAPSPQHVWTDGYWAFRDGRYVWVPGTYQLAPQPAARWVPARWV